MGPFIQNPLRSCSSQRVQQRLFAIVYFTIEGQGDPLH